ncbi:MAG: hypothetical protein LR015_03405 [Verrucomicrobia bacterium]|nr:hypothetical protein [Verrucomicrobiota bacterium]
MEVAGQALDSLPEVSAELIDLRSIIPLDLATIEQSVRKTGRLVIVQEDAETCSVGQNIISRLLQIPGIWQSLKAAPTLVAKPDVNIGYHPNLEYAALPDKARVVAAIHAALAVQSRATLIAETGSEAAIQNGAGEGMVSEKREIRVPILGEGISSARVVIVDRQTW